MMLDTQGASDTADKLVRLFHNLRFLKQIKNHNYNYSEPTIAWTEDSEHSGITKYNPSKVCNEKIRLCRGCLMNSYTHSYSRNRCLKSQGQNGSKRIRIEL